MKGLTLRLLVRHSSAEIPARREGRTRSGGVIAAPPTGVPAMARPRNDAAHVTAALDGLVRALTGVVEAITRVVLMRGRSRKGGGRKRRGVEVGSAERKRPGPGKGNKRHAASVAFTWAKYTPAERAARVAKMHAWRKKKA